MGIKNAAKLAFKPIVDPQKCNGCEDCIEVCTAQVFVMKSGKAMVLNPDDCQGCENCKAVCRKNAITVEDTGVQLSSTCLALLKNIL